MIKKILQPQNIEGVTGNRDILELWKSHYMSIFNHHTKYKMCAADILITDAEVNSFTMIHIDEVHNTIMDLSY